MKPQNSSVDDLMVSFGHMTGNTGLGSYLQWVLEDLYLRHHAASDHVCLLGAHQEILSQLPSTCRANGIQAGGAKIK